MSTALDWHIMIDYRHPKFMVKGHELAQTLYGPSSRFAIVEVRAMMADRSMGTRYRVRDAQTVSDAEVKAGIRPKIVWEGESFDEAKAYCDRA